MGVDGVWTVVSIEFAGDGVVCRPSGFESGDGRGADLVEHCGNGAGFYIRAYGIDGEPWTGGGGRVCGDSFDGEGCTDLSEARGAGDREFNVAGWTGDRNDADWFCLSHHGRSFDKHCRDGKPIAHRYDNAYEFHALRGQLGDAHRERRDDLRLVNGRNNSKHSRLHFWNVFSYWNQRVWLLRDGFGDGHGAKSSSATDRFD